MHLSLAKQDTFIAEVNFKVLPTNEAPLSCILLRNPQMCVQKSVHYITCHLVTLHIKNTAPLLKLDFVTNVNAEREIKL
jgi:hypothetical protein